MSKHLARHVVKLYSVKAAALGRIKIDRDFSHYVNLKLLNGQKKYFKLFNEKKISKYIIDKSLNKKTYLF